MYCNSSLVRDTYCRLNCELKRMENCGQLAVGLFTKKKKERVNLAQQINVKKNLKTDITSTFLNV